MEDRTVLITGGSVGLGRTTALRFATSGGYRLVINYVVKPEEAENLLSELRNLGVSAMAVYADVSQPKDVQEMFKTVEESYGGVDILVNNAGIRRDGLALRMNHEEWQQVIDVNLSSAFYCSQAAIRHMIRQRWGRIINISSVVGVMGNAGQVNYGASKAGMIGLTKSLARELASRGITVNALAPGYIGSAMTAELTEEQREKILSNIPAGWFGEARDVAAAAFFLASDDARYITGHVLHVDGGLAM
ncbi:MAG: 3-oxoacyl-[acyl-carrier-protein] reductase [Symbiobacteriaceae bacterium]|nr:3-oxoacyl-[acyl-carrier-protein] reductase [Symbiobacteriaceae bacterium]